MFSRTVTLSVLQQIWQTPFSAVLLFLPLRHQDRITVSQLKEHSGLLNPK